MYLPPLFIHLPWNLTMAELSFGDRASLLWLGGLHDLDYSIFIIFRNLFIPWVSFEY